MAMMADMSMATMSSAPRSEEGWKEVFMGGEAAVGSGRDELVTQDEPGGEHRVGGRHDSPAGPHGLHGDLQLLGAGAGRGQIGGAGAGILDGLEFDTIEIVAPEEG